MFGKINTIHLRRYSTYEFEIAIKLGFTGSKNYQTFLMWINEYISLKRLRLRIS